MNQVKIIFELSRPKHWVKNVFVIAPVVFSYAFLSPYKIGLSVLAFFIFSLVSSSIYILNDILDVDLDRQHPLKRNRPIARGAVSLSLAYSISIILGGLSLVASYFISPHFLAAVLSYVILNILYSVWFKHLFLLDMFSVALGFVIRILAGIAAIGVSLSPWILGATFFLSLFIITVKRMQELRMVADGSPRPVMSFYTLEFLREIRFISLILSMAIFIFYAFLDVKSVVFLSTILPVTYGFFRFLWLAESGSIHSDNPTDILFKDFHMQAVVIIFILLVTTIFTLRFTSYASLLFIFPQ